MSNYIYVAYDFVTLEKEYEEGKNRSTSSLELVKKMANNLAKSPDFQGKTADSIKAYLETTYSVIPELLSTLIITAYNNYVAYFGKYLVLTGASGKDYEERIATEELETIVKKLVGWKTQIVGNDSNTLGGIDGTFSNEITTLKNNGDISFGYEPMTSIPTAYQAMTNTLNNLVNDIGTIETFKEFANMQPMVDDIKERIGYLMQVKPSTFDINKYQLHYRKSDTIENYKKMITEVTAKSDQIQHAKTVAMDMEQTKAIDDRAKETAWIGLLTDIVCTVATVAATATLGPVGAIVVGAAAGAIKSAVHEGLDQYVATGAAIGEMDWGKIGIKAAIGGVTGAATSAIGVGAGAATKAIGDLSSPILQTTAKMGIGILRNEANTLIEHGGNALETGFIGVYEGKSWDNAWSEAGDVFTADLDKDLMKGAVSGVTSNLTGFTGKMDDGWLKSGTNVVLSGAASAIDYSFESMIDGEEITWTGALAAGGKGVVSGTVKEAFNDFRSDHFSVSQWEQSEGNGFTKYMVAFAAGATEQYLSKNGGAYVEALINGDEDAADNLAFVDKDGKPTSALYNIATGGAQNTAKLAYDKHFAPGVSKTEENVEMKDADGNTVTGERVTTNYGSGKILGSRKVVSETYTKVTTDKDGVTTKTDYTTYYERGKEIGSGKQTTVSGMDKTTGEKVTMTESTSSYTRRDKATVSSGSSSITRENEKTGMETTTSTEQSSTTNNRFGNHKTTEEKSSTTTYKDKNADVTETSTTKTKTESTRMGGETKSYTTTQTNKTEYGVKSGENKQTYTSQHETKESVTKNDFRNSGKYEKTVTDTNTSKNTDKDISRRQTYTEKENGSSRTQDKNYYKYEKRDDKTVTGNMKTNESIIGKDRYNSTKADTKKADERLKTAQDSAVQNIKDELKGFKPADQLMSGW